MALGQISYVNPDDEFKSLWQVPQNNAAQSYGNANYSAQLADPWSKYRDNFAKMANAWGQDPSQIGALPGVKYQYDKGMDAASRRLQAKGATGGGRLMQLMTEGQGLAQSTSMPWLQMAGKFGGVDHSSPSNAARNYMEMITRGQAWDAMAAGNKAERMDASRNQQRGGGSNFAAPATPQYTPAGGGGGGYSYSSPVSNLPDPRAMTLDQINRELYASSSGPTAGYGVVGTNGSYTGITPSGQVNLDQFNNLYDDYFGLSGSDLYDPNSYGYEPTYDAYDYGYGSGGYDYGGYDDWGYGDYGGYDDYGWE